MIVVVLYGGSGCMCCGRVLCDERVTCDEYFFVNVFIEQLLGKGYTIN